MPVDCDVNSKESARAAIFGPALVAAGWSFKLQSAPSGGARHATCQDGSSRLHRGLSLMGESLLGARASHDAPPVDALARTVWVEEFDISSGREPHRVQVRQSRHLRHLDGADSRGRTDAAHRHAGSRDGAALQNLIKPDQAQVPASQRIVSLPLTPKRGRSRRVQKYKRTQDQLVGTFRNRRIYA